MTRTALILIATALLASCTTLTRDQLLTAACGAAPGLAAGQPHETVLQAVIGAECGKG